MARRTPDTTKASSRSKPGEKKRVPAKPKDIPTVDLVQARADFVRYYIEQDFRDATGAYQRAYPNANESTAAVEACRLLKDPKIQEAFAGELSALIAEKRVPLEKRILDTWIVRAFYDPTEILDLSGTLKIKETELRKRGLHVCIDGIIKRINAQGKIIVEYKLADRDKALDMLQKYISMIKNPDQNVNVHTDEGLTIILNGVKPTEPKA